MQDLRKRTKDFALEIIRLNSSLPHRHDAHTLGQQLFRSGTSVGAQYREACRAKSDADFISKIEGASQELDETIYWIELASESGMIEAPIGDRLIGEANELMAMFVTMCKNIKRRKQES